MLRKDNKVLCNNCFRLVSSNRGSRHNHNNCCPLRKIMEGVSDKDRYSETEVKMICTGCSMPFDNFYEYASNHQPCQVHSQFMLQFNINNEKIRASLQQLGDDIDYKNFFTKVNDEATPKGKFEDVTENNIEYSSTTSIALSDTISSFDKEQSKKRKVQKFLGQSEYAEEEKDEDVDLIKQKSDFSNGELKKQLKESAERIETLMEQIVKLSDLDARSMGKVGVINNLRMNDILHLEKIISNDLILVQQKRAALEKEEKEWKSCAICKENEKTIVLYPCSHMCLCNFCASAVKLEQCPICNADILLKVSNKM